MRKTLLSLMALLFAITAQAQCPPASPLSTPYFEDFDSEASGQTGTYSNCWIATTTTDPNWETESSGTANSSNTGPRNDVSGSGIYVYMETSGGSAGDTSGLITPDIDLSNLTNPELTFFYHMFGGAMGTLAVEIWDGSTWTQEWSLSGQQQTGELDPWRLAIVNLSNYSGTIKIKFLGTKGSPTGGASSWESDMSIDEVKVDEAITCPFPQFLTANQITASTAVIGWDSVAAATSGYTIIYGTAGFNPATGGLSTTATADSVQLTGLSAATFYDAYVIADCGMTNGISDTAGPLSFTTLCTPFTAPYSSNFDNDNTGEPANCWAEYNNYSTFAYARVESNPPFVSPVSAPNLIEFYNRFQFGPGDTLMAISPQFTDMVNSDKQIRFQAATNDLASKLIIGTTSSQSPGAPITPIDTITFASTSTWEQIIFPIDTAIGYNGTDQFIVLMYDLSSAATFDYIFVDDFNYEVAPPCPRPIGVNINSVSSNSATISFTASGDSVDIEWGPAGFSQGTGCAATFASSGPATINNTVGQPCAVTLGANTNYSFYIRANCTSTANGTSPWVGPFSFRTACGAVAAPYFENFDGWGPGSGSTFSVTDSLDPCWSRNPEPPGGTSVYTWLVDDNGTGSSGTGPTGSAISGNYMYTEASSGSSGDRAELLSPIMDISSLTVPYLSLGVHGVGGQLDTLFIDYWDGNAWASLYRIEGPIAGQQQGDPFIAYEDTLRNITGATTQIRISANSLGCCAGDWAIDDFAVYDAPACGNPNFLAVVQDSITDTSSFFNWEAGTGTFHILEVGPPGFTPGTGGATARVVVTDTFAAVSGLLPNTSYDVYVADSCAGVGISIFDGPRSFQTKCATPLPALLPWSDGFENYTSGPTFQGAANFCNPTYNWEFTSESSNGRLRLQGGTGFYNTGAQAATLDHNPSVFPEEVNYLELTINLSNYTNAGGINLSFAYLNHGQAASPNNRVWARGSLNDPWIEIYNLDLNSNTGVYDSVSGIDIKAPLNANSQTLGPTTQIRFGQNGRFSAVTTTFSDGYSFDDVALEAVTCPNPSNLSVTGLIDTAATLQWNQTSLGQGAEVWFGPTGFLQGTQAIGGVRTTTNSNSLLLDTLSEQSCYDYYVRTICGAGDTSDWVGPFTFCTPCSAKPAPYVENWDALSAGLTGSFGNCWEGFTTTPSSSFSSYNWETNTGPTGSGSTGPTGDATTGSGTYIYTEASSGGAGDVATLVSPLVNLSGQTNPELSFAYHMYGNEIDTLFVDINDGSQWNNAVIQLNEQQQFSSTDAWLDTVVDLSPYAANNIVQVRFRLRSRGCCSGDAALDDITIGDPILNDAELLEILVKQGCGDPATEVSAVFANLGRNAITTMPVTAAVSGTINTVLNGSYSGNLTETNTDTVLIGTLNTALGAELTVEVDLNLAGDQVARNDTATTDTLSFIPLDPIGFDSTACVSDDSAYLRSLSIPGIRYGWYASNNPTDTIPIATGDTFAVGLPTAQLTYYLGYLSGNPDSLGTPFLGGNGQAGNAFDVLPSSTIDITGMSFNIDNTAQHTINVYYRTGSATATNVASVAGWTFHEAVSVTGNGAGNPARANFSTPLTLTGGTTQAIMTVITSGGTNMDYTNGTSVGTVLASNNDLTIYEGYGISWPLGSAFNPRNWNGVLHYGGGGCSDTRIPLSITLAQDTAEAAFSVTGTQPNFNFDASGSVNGSSYAWDFGDGNSGSGITTSHTYASNGSYQVVLTVYDSTGCISQDTTTEMINVNVGLEENPLANSLELFPNPAEDKVNISFQSESGPVEIRVTDMQGKLILNLNRENPEAIFREELAVASWASGVYIIEIKQGEYQARRRLTVK